MATLMQTAAVAVGNGTAIAMEDSTKEVEVGILVSGITTATVTIEVSPDNGTTWEIIGSAVTADKYVQVGKVMATNIRARISAYTTGTINVWFMGTGGTTVTAS